MEFGGYLKSAPLYVKRNGVSEAWETLRALLRMSPGLAGAVRLFGALGRP